MPNEINEPTSFDELNKKQFVTKREAVILTGKSPRTIERLISDKVHSTKPEDAKFMVRQMTGSGDKFYYLINREMLIDHFSKQKMPEYVMPPQAQQPVDSAQPSGDTELLKRSMELLQQANGILERELGEKNEQIKRFQEDQARKDVLLQQLQSKVLLIEQAKQTDVEPVKKKRGWFNRLLGRD